MLSSCTNWRPAEPPKAAGPSQLHHLFKSAPSAKARPKAQAKKSEGYYRSQYAVIDPEHTITQLIKLVKGAEDLSEIGSLSTSTRRSIRSLRL